MPGSLVESIHGGGKREHECGMSGRETVTVDILRKEKRCRQIRPRLCKKLFEKVGREPRAERSAYEHDDVPDMMLFLMPSQHSHKSEYDRDIDEHDRAEHDNGIHIKNDITHASITTWYN